MANSSKKSQQPVKSAKKKKNKVILKNGRTGKEVTEITNKPRSLWKIEE